MPDETPQTPPKWYSRWKTLVVGLSGLIGAVVALAAATGSFWKIIEPFLPKNIQNIVQEKITPIDFDALNNVLYSPYISRDQIETLFGKSISENKYVENSRTTNGYFYNSKFGQIYIEYEKNKVIGWGYYSDRISPAVIADLNTANISLNPHFSDLVSWWPDWPITIGEDYSGKFSAVTYSNIFVGGKGAFAVGYLFQPALKCKNIPNESSATIASKDARCQNSSSTGQYYMIARTTKQLEMDKKKIAASLAQVVSSLNNISDHALDHMSTTIQQKMDDLRNKTDKIAD